MKTIAGITSILVCLMLLTSCTQSIDGKLEDAYIKKEKGIIYYKGEPYSGEIIYNYRNGQLKEKKNYKDGQLDGLFEEYYENSSQLLLRENYKDGQEDGLQVVYYFNGQVQTKSNYKDGREVGSFEEYYENGQLEMRWDNIAGQQYNYERYYENGQLKEKVNYKDDKPDGIPAGIWEGGSSRRQIKPIKSR